MLPLDAAKGEIADLAEEWYGPAHLQKPYSGNGEAPWWAGVTLATLRQYSWPEKGYEDDHVFEPTKEQKQRAKEIIATLPDELRKHMTPIGRYVLPCP